MVVPYVERRVPVVADERIDREFGTGALKVTPGHDPLDFEIGRDHGLPEPMAVGWDGLMSEVAGDLAGSTQEEAGSTGLAWAEERRARREARAVSPLGRHLRALPLAHRAAHLAAVVVRDGRACGACDRAPQERRVRFHPESQHRFAITSLEETPDWCISRQLWWGHQLPIWYCPDGHTTVTVDEPSACAECGSGELERESDVLDTWFSAALWPFATLGWPDETPELARYFPGNVNSTAREIIRLWENRMIWTGLEAARRRAVHDVIIHSTVLALDGRRMSKSLGTGIDPMEPHRGVRRGCDAVRAAEDLLDAGRAVLVRGDRGGAQARDQALERRAPDPAERRGRRPRRRAAARSRGALDSRATRRRSRRARGLVGSFDFAESTATLYHLTFDDFCDWYAEAIKPRLYDRDEAAISTALAALERLLALLHPVMPHVTEEIWSQLPGERGRLIVSPWPKPDSAFADDVGALNRVQEAAQIFRRSGVQVELGSDDERRIFAAVVRPEKARVDDNRDAEIERLRKEVARGEGMLANERFVSNAPAEVVAAEREKLERYRRELAALKG